MACMHITTSTAYRRRMWRMYTYVRTYNGAWPYGLWPSMAHMHFLTDHMTHLIIAVAIDLAGSQYIDYANTFTHAHLRLTSISLAKLSSKL